MKRAFTALSVMVALSMGVTSAVASASPNSDEKLSISEAVDDTIVNSRHSYSVPDVEKTVTTEDGMSVNLKKLNEHIFRTAPLTSNPFSHEVRITMQGLAEVKGGAPESVHSLTTGYLVGCQIDASEPVKVKAQFPLKVNPFSPFFKSAHNTEVTQYDEFHVPKWDKFGFPKFGLGLGFTSGFSIETKVAYWTTVRPGRIVKVPLASYAFTGNETRWTDFRNLHLYIDGCPGNVSLRSYVEFVDGADIPGHIRKQNDKLEKLKSKQIPRAPQIKFAEATDKLKRVENKALKLDKVEPDEKLKGIGDTNSDRFSTKKPEESDEPETEFEKQQRELAEMGKPNIETLTSPYGDSSTEQIEGLKFTIVGDVRWMSTILPQTTPGKDLENRRKNVHDQMKPARDYKKQVETNLNKQAKDLQARTSKPRKGGMRK